MCIKKYFETTNIKIKNFTRGIKSMNTINSDLKEYMEIGIYLLGKPTSEIPIALERANEKRQKRITESISELKRSPENISSFIDQSLTKSPKTQATPTWYFGSVTTAGFIRATLAANISFGNHGNWTFNGSAWSGPQALGGGGGGFWSELPSQNQEMDFSFGGAAFGAGELQVYWSINGIVVGQLIAAVGGTAISGGTGSGKWTKD